MTLAIVLTVIASLLWSITNHTDRFLVNGLDKAASSIKTLMIFSTLVAGAMAATIWLAFNGWQIPSTNTAALLLIFGSSLSYAVAAYLYFYALDGNESSRVTVLSQLTPVFSYILGFIFLHETLSLHQIFGSLIILAAAIIISIDFRKKTKKTQKTQKNRLRAFIFMILSCIAFAVYYLLFSLSQERSSYDACAFWYQIGMMICGISLFIIPSYRRSFLQAIRKNGKIYVPLNLLNELFNSSAVLLANYAIIFMPLALANILSYCLQPALTFILGAIGMKLLPRFFHEELDRQTVVQKVGCIFLIGIGFVVIFL